MLRRLLGLLVVGLMLAGCGTPVPGGGVKDVKAASADNAVTVSWAFDGDKTAIKGFRVFRNAGGDSSSYSRLADVTNVNATTYSDTDVEQGETFKYGVAVINSDNTVDTTVNQAGAAVGPKTLSCSGSMAGKWTLDAVVTKTPEDKKDELGRKFFFILDITEASGTLSGTVNLRNEGATVPSAKFGESKVEGTKNADGTYTFKLIEVSEDPATTDIKEEKSWTVTACGNAGSTAFTGTYVNVFEFEGTVTGTKIP